MIIREAIEYRVRHLAILQEAIADGLDEGPADGHTIADALRADAASDHPELFAHTLEVLPDDTAAKLADTLSTFTRSSAAHLNTILGHGFPPGVEHAQDLWFDAVDRSESAIRRGLNRIGVSIEINAAIHFADSRSLYLDTDKLIEDLKAHDPFNGITTIVDDPYSLVA